MHIGIDFDDTLLDTRRVLVGILNRLHGTNHQLESLQDYYLMGTYGCTSEYMESVFTQHFDELHAPAPFPDVQTTIQQLQARGHAITIITARPAIHMPPLHEWLARHHLPGDRVISASKSGEKALRAAESNIDIFIDDNPRHALALATRGIRVLLLDRPYNRTCQATCITRVPHWNAIRDFLISSPKDEVTALDPTQIGLLNKTGLCRPT
jgi:uncharacterized HAD superfamily protein